MNTLSFQWKKHPYVLLLLLNLSIWFLFILPENEELQYFQQRYGVFLNRFQNQKKLQLNLKRHKDIANHFQKEMKEDFNPFFKNPELFFQKVDTLAQKNQLKTLQVKTENVLNSVTGFYENKSHLVITGYYNNLMEYIQALEKLPDPHRIERIKMDTTENNATTPLIQMKLTLVQYQSNTIKP